MEPAPPKPSPLSRFRPNRLLTALFRSVWRLRRGLTLGAQGAVIDRENRVLLVRHVYRPGWCFPGGGVEKGETLIEALARELDEEVGVTLTEAPTLHGVFSNSANFPGDHVALFVVRHWDRRGEYRRRGEIAEAGMFSWQELPERIERGTRARLAEIFEHAPIGSHW